MNTTELKKDVRDNITRANSRDYTDEEIERNIDEEYKKLQSMMQREGRIEWIPTVYDFTINSSTFGTQPNLNIQRVDVRRPGSTYWKTIDRTTYHDYMMAEKSEYCSCGKTLTRDLERTCCPEKYVQTTEGMHVFPVPSTGLDVKVYTRGFDVIPWGSTTYEPLLPIEFHRLLSLKAGMMYRDLEDTNSLEWIKDEYKELFDMFLEDIKEGGSVKQMSNKKKKYK